MEIKAIRCPTCGANVDYDGTHSIITCQYCGTEISVETADLNESAIERKRLELRQERHEERHERREKRHEERRERREERHEALRSLFGLKK